MPAVHGMHAVQPRCHGLLASWLGRRGRHLQVAMPAPKLRLLFCSVYPLYSPLPHAHCASAAANAAGGAGGHRQPPGGTARQPPQHGAAQAADHRCGAGVQPEHHLHGVRAVLCRAMLCCAMLCCVVPSPGLLPCAERRICSPHNGIGAEKLEQPSSRDLAAICSVCLTCTWHLLTLAPTLLLAHHFAASPQRAWMHAPPPWSCEP